jgi:CspA family cold shock protein
MRTLRQDQRVSYDLEEDRRGKMAACNLRDASDAAAGNSSDEGEQA